MGIELIIGISFFVGVFFSFIALRYYWKNVFKKYRDEMHEQYLYCLKEMEKKYKGE